MTGRGQNTVLMKSHLANTLNMKVELDFFIVANFLLLFTDETSVLHVCYYHTWHCNERFLIG